MDLLCIESLDVPLVASLTLLPSGLCSIHLELPSALHSVPFEEILTSELAQHSFHLCYCKKIAVACIFICTYQCEILTFFMFSFDQEV